MGALTKIAGRHNLVEGLARPQVGAALVAGERPVDGRRRGGTRAAARRDGRRDDARCGGASAANHGGRDHGGAARDGDDRGRDAGVLGEGCGGAGGG